MKTETVIILAVAGVAAFYLYQQHQSKVHPQNPNQRNPEKPLVTNSPTVGDYVNQGVQVLEALRSNYGDF